MVVAALVQPAQAERAQRLVDDELAAALADAGTKDGPGDGQGLLARDARGHAFTPACSMPSAMMR